MVTEEQLQKAIVKAEEDDKYLHQVLVDMHFLDSTSMLQIAAKEWEIEYIELLDEELDVETVKIFPEAMARRLLVIPIGKTEEILTVAMTDPFDLFASREIEIRVRPHFKVKPVLSLPDDIEKKLNEIYVKESQEEIYSILQNVNDKEIEEIEQLTGSVENEIGDNLEIDLTKIAIEKAQQSYIISLENHC